MRKVLWRVLVATVSLAEAGCLRTHQSSAPTRLDVNTAPAEMLLARVCDVVPMQAVCSDASQAMSLVQLLDMTQRLEPAPLFSSADEFLDFLAGRGGTYAMIKGFIGSDSPLLRWAPLVLPDPARAELLLEFSAEK